MANERGLNDPNCLCSVNAQHARLLTDEMWVRILPGARKREIWVQLPGCAVVGVARLTVGRPSIFASVV